MKEAGTSLEELLSTKGKLDEYIRGYVAKQARREVERSMKGIRKVAEQALQLSLSTRNYINRFLLRKKPKHI